jgi:hypothetical protein
MPNGTGPIPTEASEPTIDLRDYDLTAKLCLNLDRHLAIPLVNHMADIALYPPEQLAKAQYDLVSGTNMVDYIQQVYEQLGDSVRSPVTGMYVLRGR